MSAAEADGIEEYKFLSGGDGCCCDCTKGCVGDSTDRLRCPLKCWSLLDADADAILMLDAGASTPASSEICGVPPATWDA
jgi:hypothetical protein